MTYNELIEQLKKLSPEQLAMDVTVYDNLIDEFLGNCRLLIQSGDDILEDNHPYISC